MEKRNNKIPEPVQCPQCGIPFECSTSHKCWCYEMDVDPDSLDYIQHEYNGCLCPDCLEKFTRDH